jgi:hypothetical protein
VITLATKHSKRTFKIHKALLEAKSRGLFSRLENFKEGAENIYRFHDTTENTIVRFIEWAYRDDYPETVRNVSSASASVVQPPSADEGTTDGDGPLSCHMQMYIFAHVYGISRLESMAYDRITNSLKYIGKPTDEKTKQEVISVMDMGFSEILQNDRLLNWLGHYVSFCLNEFKESNAFQKLLEETPSLSLVMLKHLNAASLPPWPHTSFLSTSSTSGAQTRIQGLFGSAPKPVPPGSLFNTTPAVTSPDIFGRP